MIVLLAALLVTGLAIHQVMTSLTFHTDTADMIDERTPFKTVYRAYKAPFPKLSSALTIIIEGDTPDRAASARDALADALSAQGDLFPYIYTPGGGAFFARNGLLYLDEDELLDLLDSLADAQPLLQRLRRDMSLRGFLAVLDLAVEDALNGNGELERLKPLFQALSDTIHARLDGASTQMSWQTIMTGKTPPPEDYRQTIIVQPAVSDYDKLVSGQTAMKAVRATADELGFTAENGVKVWLTGRVALGNDELRTVREGAETAGLVSLVLVTIILCFGVRSARLVLVALVTLILGLIWTAGFAALAIGHLNMISVAFAVLFVGLGIDFSIHLVLRLRELAGQGHENPLQESIMSIGGALGLCALSTAVGFYAFFPTAFAGVSELGIIAGTGMFIALILNLTVLPAILSFFPLTPARAKAAAPIRLGRLEIWLRRSARQVLAGAGLLGLLAVLSLPNLRFDYNPINLQNPDVDSVKILKRLMAEGDPYLWSAALRTSHPIDLPSKQMAFEALDSVSLTLSLDDFVPPNQESRWEIIQDIAQVNEPDPFAIATYEPPTTEETRSHILLVERKLASAPAADPGVDAAQALAAALRRLIDAIDQSADTIETIRDGIIGALPARLAALDRTLEAEPFTAADLPPALTDRYVGTDGSLRLEVFPSKDIMADNQDLQDFVDAARTVDANITGDPILVLEAGKTVIASFVQALITALFVIFVLLLLVTLRFKDSILIMIPLLFTSLITAATMTGLGIPLNFANVIVLPLLLGIGVDSGIHLVARHRADPNAPLLATSTARAVLVSALTTMAGFGSLALSPHVGTASMGLLLLIGVGLTVVATLVLLPTLIYGLSRERLT